MVSWRSQSFLESENNLTTKNGTMQQEHQKKVKMYKPKRLLRMNIGDVGLKGIDCVTVVCQNI